MTDNSTHSRPVRSSTSGSSQSKDMIKRLASISSGCLSFVKLWYGFVPSIEWREEHRQCGDRTIISHRLVKLID